jgi:hypothetical protein
MGFRGNRGNKRQKAKLFQGVKRVTRGAGRGNGRGNRGEKS